MHSGTTCSPPCSSHTAHSPMLFWLSSTALLLIWQRLSDRLPATGDTQAGGIRSRGADPCRVPLLAALRHHGRRWATRASRPQIVPVSSCSSTLSAPLTNHCLLPRCVMPLRRELGDVHGLAFVGQWRSTPCRRRRGSRLSSSSTRSTGSRPPLASRRGRDARLGGLQAVVGGPGGSAVYGRGGGDAAAENPMAAAVPACLGAGVTYT